MPIALSTATDSNILLEADTSRVFGGIDPTGQKILEVLGKEVIVQLLAAYIVSRSKESGDCTRKVRNTTRSERPKSHHTLGLFAILYGPSTLFEAVGTFAAKCRLYLQHPKHCNRDVPYRSPHCLSPEDGHTISTFDLDAASSSLGCLELEIPANPIDLFADAAEQNALSEAYTSSNLSTELYKHQKQALTFMMQRERGWAMDGQHKDIWSEEHDSFGRSVYQNLISGMKQMTRPDQFQGGLLIDAPGLGKTLSIIALILSDADNRETEEHAQGSSSTTLLVVPKTCESPSLPSANSYCAHLKSNSDVEGRATEVNMTAAPGQKFMKFVLTGSGTFDRPTR